MQWASDGRYTRMISAFLLATWSMKPGSWCEKPLWSCRQTCELSRQLSDAIGRRHGIRRVNRPADLQPLCVLVEHRVDDVDERLVAVEEPVPAREQVTLEPSLAHV